jgi:CDP-4-dehydro-6-deoxyglucose reductase, E1
MLRSNFGKISKKVLYAQAVYNSREKQAVSKSLNNSWLVGGPLVARFENKIAKQFGNKFGIAVNSGSSANLIAISSLRLPEHSEIITPACTFSTTASAITLNGHIPVFIDCEIGRYTINENDVEKAISLKTKAILVPQLIGGICDMVKLRKICNKHKLYLINDSCDTIGATLLGKRLGVYSDISTTSFYGSHIITAMGTGGMILTDNKEFRQIAVNMRDWGRIGDDREAFDKRFNFTIDNIPYDSKFLYSEFGYNFKMSEASAAFGLEQLNKLPKFTKTRKKVFIQLYEYFSEYQEFFYLPTLMEGAKTNWLAFPLTIKKKAPFSRYELLKHLEESGIQTRVLFSGNISRHPAYKKIKFRTFGNLKNSDQIMAAGFLIGCHQGMTKKHVDYIKKTAEKFLKRFLL